MAFRADDRVANRQNPNPFTKVSPFLMITNSITVPNGVNRVESSSSVVPLGIIPMNSLFSTNEQYERIEQDSDRSEVAF